MLSDWFGKIKKEQVILVIIMGILFVVVAYPGLKQLEDRSEDTPGTGGQTGESGEEESAGLEDYVNQMERRLTRVLGEMDQVGKVQVFITVRESEEQVVEKDVTSSRDEAQDKTGESAQETTVMEDTGDGASPYVKKSVTPRIEGVLVVAEGGGSQKVVNDITEAVSALFSIEVHKIKVVRMKTGTN